MLKNIIVLVIIFLAGYYAYSMYGGGDGIAPMDASDLPPLTSE
ncbi:hypothetical protein N9O74_02485 [Methylophilaceae bacterium]|nr:hypothetical protein [Methylophilaceae bacterium]|tara:strand:+ start:6128 stop:6256 length:129 start_codon:yes stop_codon:yes gene_type:complete